MMERVLGVVGTFVLDRIVGLPGRPEPVEGLGGIAYALSAASAALPAGWRALPIARVGRDAVPSVGAWMEELGLHDGGLRAVPEANNRVELRYHDDGRRTERLTGGVGSWSWSAMAPLVDGCDALLVNFISGHELALDTTRRLRDAFDGPIYADLHSLFLGMGRGGVRRPRALPEWDAWVACFDAIQVNADELDLLRGSQEASVAIERAIALGPDLVACTLGPRGALCWAVASRPRAFSGRGASPRGDADVSRHEIPTEPVAYADPTGCGDVWGATMCAGLLAGSPVVDAAAVANRLAGVAAGRSGVAGLARCLADEVERTVARPCDPAVPGTSGPPGASDDPSKIIRGEGP